MSPFGASGSRPPSRSDQEFLPAALAILETPPSPIRIRLIWTICLLFTFAIGWSYFGQIDIVAVAQGKFQPQGHVKTVQPTEAGKVVAIHVENGRRVAEGDVLVELDPAEARADLADAQAALSAYRAEQLRRLAAAKAVESDVVDENPKIEWPDDLPQVMRSREERVLRGDLAQLAADTRGFDAQIAQKDAEHDRLQETIDAQGDLIATLQERVAMRASLVSTGATSKANLIDAQETLQTQATTLVAEKGELKEAVAAAEVLRQERRKAIEHFKADNDQKLDEAERQIDDDTQKVAKAQTKMGYMSVISPIAGVVSGLTVTTLGQAVNAGEEIMRIVPDGSALEIECYVENKDIGFVGAGQSAVVKVESFPFTRYGVLSATVERIGHDAIPEPDAQTLEGNPAKAVKANFFGGAQRTQNLVFPVTLVPSRESMDINGAEIPLTPGMAVTVEFRTGKRRILEYLFSPLVQTVSSAMKER